MTEEENVTRLVTTKPDAEIAADLKGKLKPYLDAVGEILTEGHAQGFTISFSMGINAFGQAFISTLEVSKKF